MRDNINSFLELKWQTIGQENQDKIVEIYLMRDNNRRRKNQQVKSANLNKLEILNVKLVLKSQKTVKSGN